MRKYGVKRWDLGGQLRLDSRQKGVSSVEAGG